MRRAEERWCLALNVSSQRSAQLRQNPETITHKHTHTGAHTHIDIYSHCVLINCSIHLLTNTEIWITPRSWKQTLWILKDFDAFIKDWLCFEFIWISWHDVHETSNMVWILMAQWAMCDKRWNVFECCAVLGWLVGAVSLWICTVLWKLAKPDRYEQPQKLVSLSTPLCSLKPLNLKKKRKKRSGLKTHKRLKWYWWAKKI